MDSETGLVVSHFARNMVMADSVLLAIFVALLLGNYFYPFNVARSYDYGEPDPISEPVDDYRQGGPVYMGPGARFLYDRDPNWRSAYHAYQYQLALRYKYFRDTVYGYACSRYQGCYDTRTGELCSPTHKCGIDDPAQVPGYGKDNNTPITNFNFENSVLDQYAIDVTGATGGFNMEPLVDNLLWHEWNGMLVPDVGTVGSYGTGFTGGGGEGSGWSSGWGGGWTSGFNSLGSYGYSSGWSWPTNGVLYYKKF